jgi:hypothetical protein
MKPVYHVVSGLSSKIAIKLGGGPEILTPLFVLTEDAHQQQ